MNANEMITSARLHARFAQEYLDVMHECGVKGYPSISWGAGLNGAMVAVIVWPDGGECVTGYPCERLADEVIRRVLSRLVPNN